MVGCGGGGLLWRLWLEGRSCWSEFLLGACEAGVNFYFEAYVMGQGSYCNQMTQGHLRSTSTLALVCPVFLSRTPTSLCPASRLTFLLLISSPTYSSAFNPPVPLLAPFFPSHQRGDRLGVPGRAPAVGNRTFYVFCSSYSETGIKETNTFQGQG